MKRLKLRGRIIEKYGTIGRFAEENEITRQYVSAVLSGDATPRSMALKGWCSVLEIGTDEVPIFFGADV